MIKRFFVSEKETIRYKFYLKCMCQNWIVKIAEKVIGLPLNAPEGKWKLGAEGGGGLLKASLSTRCTDPRKMK